MRDAPFSRRALSEQSVPIIKINRVAVRICVSVQRDRSRRVRRCHPTRVHTPKPPRPIVVISLLRVVLPWPISKVRPELVHPVRRHRPLFPVREVRHQRVPVPSTPRPHVPQPVRHHQRPVRFNQLAPKVHVVLVIRRRAPRSLVPVRAVTAHPRHQLLSRDPVKVKLPRPARESRIPVRVRVHVLHHPPPKRVVRIPRLRPRPPLRRLRHQLVLHVPPVRRGVLPAIPQLVPIGIIRHPDLVIVGVVRHSQRRRLRHGLVRQVPEPVVAVRLSPHRPRRRPSQPVQRIVGVRDVFPRHVVVRAGDPPVVLRERVVVLHVHQAPQVHVRHLQQAVVSQRLINVVLIDRFSIIQVQQLPRRPVPGRRHAIRPVAAAISHRHPVQPRHVVVLIGVRRPRRPWIRHRRHLPFIVPLIVGHHARRIRRAGVVRVVHLQSHRLRRHPPRAVVPVLVKERQAVALVVLPAKPYLRQPPHAVVPVGPPNDRK